jgi:hypothetical protein
MLPVPTFEYAPLIRPQEIRVVTLQHGIWDDPIHCKLENVDFTKRYEAVSYEWGSRGEEECIYLNNQPFPIRKNLYVALRHFRRSRWDRVLWIDALCINQKEPSEENHNAEKSQQLSLMGKIYSQAWDTLVWLGPAQDCSDLAISHLERIGLNDRDASFAVLQDQHEPHENAMRAILALCNRSYWQRIWVVQEIRLARQITICCGERTIAGETFMLAGKTIQNAFNPKIPCLMQQISESLASKIMDYSQYQDLRLKDWLITTRESKSSVPRDKVYALVNLGTDCRGSNSLKLDCSKNATVSQVYKKVLKECSVDKQSRRPVYDVFDLSEELQRALNTASGSVKLTDKDNEPIWICGIFSAQITSFQDDRKIAWSHELYPKNISEGDDAIWSTKSNSCILNFEAGKSMEIIRKRRYSDPKAPVQIINNIVIAASPQMIQLDDVLMKLQTMCRSLKLKDSQHRGRPFRCGGQDCSGFAPTDAEVGDKICRFPGSRIGLVFRKLIDRDNSWWLVGRVITDKRFKISEKDMKNFWRGDPQHPASVSFGCDDALFIKLSMVTLQRLTSG